MVLNKLYLLLVVLIVGTVTATAQSREEFVGPFKSWCNVKTQFNAKGDGRTDDTRSLQAALDNLTNFTTNFNTGDKAYAVVYLPAGTYKISQTLVLKGKLDVMILGENPATTILQWAGADNDTMFLANGSAYFKVARFTWQANGRKGMEGIGIHWLNKWDDGKTRSFASLNIELSDHIFAGGFAVGIGGGTFAGAGGTGSNDSEITIRRSTFDYCTDAAIKITGYNALDYWIWYCRFIRCRIAVSCRNGNYHLYKSFFKESYTMDLYNYGSYYTSVRDCYSTGSMAFSRDDGGSCNPFKRIFQKNIVINTIVHPIEYRHLGNLSLTDNIITSVAAKKSSKQVLLGSWCPGFYNVLSLNNKYSNADPFELTMPRKKIITANDGVFRGTVLSETAFTASLPATPALIKRQVFDVPANATADVIQQIINKAAAATGSKPVVHFPVGKYYLDKTIVIPPGCDMQLAGDGFLQTTQLLHKEVKYFNNKPLLLVKGPSYITISDIGIGSTSSNADPLSGIRFQQVDQPGAQLIIDQLYSSADTSLNLKNLDYINVEKNNSFFSAGNYVSGGTLQRAGKGTFQVNCFGGQFARLTVLNNARFTAKDCWFEGTPRIPLNLAGEGQVTIDGAMIAPYHIDSTASILINKFIGKITLVNMYVQGSVQLNNADNRLDLLCWNVHFYYKMNPLDQLQKTKARAMFYGLTSQCFDKSSCEFITSHEPAYKNITDPDLFLKQMMEPAAKSLPASPVPVKKGTSNIYLSRVGIGFLKSGVEVIN